MASSAQEWLALGIEAHLNRRFDEAAEEFEKAVAMDSGSVQAHLALGAARFTLYMRGSFTRPPNFSAAGDGWQDEWGAIEDKQKAIRTEQNSTNWLLADESLRRPD